MRTVLLALVCALLVAETSTHAQGPALEYQVKAADLYNFVKFVEWPPRPADAPLLICVAGRNPFGSALADIVRGESIDGHPLAVRMVSEPDAACQVVFVPQGAAPTAFLRSARTTPTLTVGETPGFLDQGGIINFVLDSGKVRFDINADAAARANLKISSRLLRLARNSDLRGGD